MTSEAEVSDHRFERIRVVDADPALQDLLQEWLAEEGCRFVEDDPDLVIVDLHLPRGGAAAVLKALAARHPGVRVIALSSNFFSGVEASGALARRLGVAAVLPKPLTRQALVDTLRKRLLQLT